MLLNGCINSENKISSSPNLNQDKSLDNSKNQELASEIDSDEGVSYSDSMIRALVSQQNTTTIPIDTFKVLHEINCNQSSNFNGHIFSTKSVKSYKPYQTKIDPQLQQILGVTECICKYSEAKNYSTYIFYSDQLESHSSIPISLITINKKSNVYYQLPLIKEYGNEQGNYVISSQLKSDKIIEREVNHNISYIHGIGAIDSMYLEREIYKMNTDGLFELESTSKEKSTKRNSVFDI